MKFTKRFITDIEGATSIEYALIGTLISIAILAGLTSTSNNIGEKFNNTAAKVVSAG